MTTEKRDERRDGETRRPTRTCVGCGQRDVASELVRVVVAGDEVVFDLAGGAFGRGAHLHARPDCIAKAPRGLARAFRGRGEKGEAGEAGEASATPAAGASGAAKVDARTLGALLVDACDRRMAGLLMSAYRLRQVAIGTDASLEALRREAPLAIVAVDAGSVVSSTEVTSSVVEGRVIAWRTRNELGALLGERAVAICAVWHASIAAELKRMRTAADAGAEATREGAECSRRPEAR